jgi:hypothetical protein
MLSGSFDTPISHIGLLGAIDAHGPRLTGSTSIDFNLGGLRKAQEDADSSLQDAIAEVDRLDHAINAMRTKVAKERQQNAKNLKEARGTVADQQAKVDSLQSQIDSRKSSIASHNKEIKKWKSWYKHRKWYEKTWAWAKYLRKTAPHYAAIAKLGTEIAGLETAKGTATLALKAAQEVLHGLEQGIANTPIDADPRVASLIASQAVARETLKAARSAVNVVQVPDGELTGEINLTVSTAGMASSLEANFNGKKLINGHVNLDDDPQACIDVPAFKEVCAPF